MQILNPNLTLHIGCVLLPNHLVKHLSRMKMLQLGGDYQHLLSYFANETQGLKIRLVSSKAILYVSWFLSRVGLPLWHVASCSVHSAALPPTKCPLRELGESEVASSWCRGRRRGVRREQQQAWCSPSARAVPCTNTGLCWLVPVAKVWAQGIHQKRAWHSSLPLADTT